MAPWLTQNVKTVTTQRLHNSRRAIANALLWTVDSQGWLSPSAQGRVHSVSATGHWQWHLAPTRQLRHRASLFVDDPLWTRCKYPSGPALQSQIVERSAAREAALRKRLSHPCKLAIAIPGYRRSRVGQRQPGTDHVQPQPSAQSTTLNRSAATSAPPHPTCDWQSPIRYQTIPAGSPCAAPIHGSGCHRQSPNADHG